MLRKDYRGMEYISEKDELTIYSLASIEVKNDNSPNESPSTNLCITFLVLTSHTSALPLDIIYLFIIYKSYKQCSLFYAGFKIMSFGIYF